MNLPSYLSDANGDSQALEVFRSKGVLMTGYRSGGQYRKFMLLVLALAFCYGVEWSASFFTRASVGSWYIELKKPFWTPPSILFPIVWTALYTMIGVSFWLILCEPKAYTLRLFASFFGQMLLNFTWSFAFFYLRSPLLGLFNILGLIGAIAWNIYVFAPHSLWASRLLVPYLAWVTYAATLNLAIFLMN